MEPRHEFGKEAAENEKKLKEKNKRMKKSIIKIAILLTAITAVLFFWSDIKDAVASSTPDKIKKEKSTKSKNKDKSQADEQAPASPGVTIIKKWDLPEILKEVSGIAYIDGNRFACVQDELGTIFIYNTQTASIEKEIPFAAAGDYEGLTVVNENAWVVRADGVLFEVSDFAAPKPAVKEYRTHLTVKQNVEGLCYDKKNNRLLLAIKDAEPGNADYKGIYSFDLAARKMPSEPAFKIPLAHELFANAGSGKKGGQIMPSSIAVHPVSNDMYITDGRKSRLLVINSSGAVKKLLQLDNSEFAQPEGITFKPTGELFVSNEGTKNPGNILNVEISSD